MAKSLKSHIRAEIEYFRNFGGFPQTKQELDALICAFEERSASPDHLAKIGKQLQRTMKFCPKPSEIHEAADLVAERGAVREWTGKTPVCPHGVCDGGGFITAQSADGIMLAQYCRCHAAYREPKKGAQSATSAH